MNRPRRAKNRPGRVLIPLALLLAIAVGLFGWRTDFSFNPTALVTGPSPSVTISSAPPSTPDAEQAQEATDALESCRERVKAADQVIDAAETGVGNWSDHVEAQTKANRDKITVTMLDKVFDKTREAGPQDQRRYAKAREAYRSVDASCEQVPTATKAQAADLTSCRDRAEAQAPVLRAARPTMADWQRHLDQMEHSRMNPSPNDQEEWLKAWRAAPPNINAFDKAMKRFEDEDPPRCAD